MKKILYTLLGMMLSVGAWAQTSLQEQINNAAAGATITLTENVTISQTILIDKNITIDGGNYTITSSVNNKLGAFYINTGTCTLTIQNVTIDGGSAASMAVVAYRGKANAGLTTVDSGDRDNNNSGNVINMTNCTVKNFTGFPSSYAGAVYVFGKSSANLTNCTFSGNTTSLQSTDGASGADVWAGAAATVNINGGSYEEVFVNSDKTNTASITISNGATVNELAVCVTENGGSTNQPTITIDNATVTNLVTETGNDLPASAVTTTNGGSVTNMPGNYVAQIGDKKYETLAEAVAAATAGQTVTLLADVDVSQTILIDKNITIDGATYTIASSVTNKLGTFYVNTGTCTLTIQNVTIDGGSAASMAVVAYRGKANAEHTTVDSGDRDNNNSGNVINMTNCIVKNFTGFPSSYAGAVYVFGKSSANLTNCTFSGNTTSMSTNGASGADVWAGAAATVNINAGSYKEVFVNSDSTNEAKITIVGGATVEELAVCASYKPDGSTNIPTIVVDGSTVTNLTTEEGNPIPADAITLTNEGKITNIPETEAAKILNGKNTKAFASLDDAIEAATAGQKITLLAAATATKELPDDVTIDANGKALTLPTFNVADGAELSYANVINATDNTYKVTTATYNRTGAAGTQWGTVCLPFSITESPTGYTLYTPSAVATNELTVEEVAYPVAAGTPVIFHKNNTDEVTMISSNASVKIDATPLAQSGSLALVGTFSQQNIESGLESIYFINGDKFHQAKVSLTVPAYRAYIQNTSAGVKAAVLNIVVDGDATAIEGAVISDLNTTEAIYDAAGRKLSAPQKGINIMKLANGKTVKLIIK